MVFFCEKCESQWEHLFFPPLPFHGASLRHFHLFWEMRSIIENATETTQAHTAVLMPLHYLCKLCRAERIPLIRQVPVLRGCTLSNYGPIS